MAEQVAGPRALLYGLLAGLLLWVLIAALAMGVLHVAHGLTGLLDGLSAEVIQ